MKRSRDRLLNSQSLSRRGNTVRRQGFTPDMQIQSGWQPQSAPCQHSRPGVLLWSRGARSVTSAITADQAFSLRHVRKLPPRRQRSAPTAPEETARRRGQALCILGLCAGVSLNLGLMVFQLRDRIAALEKRAQERQ